MAGLDSSGCVVLPKPLTPEECRATAELYSDEGHFRSRVIMARHGFGRGEYRYFDYPLPDLIGALRTALYPHLAGLANDWNARMGINQRYSQDHASYLARCRDAGQVRPTPLLLHMSRATITACTRTFTAISFSHCRWQSCSRSRARTLLAASSS